jgi:hypothetical protein
MEDSINSYSRVDGYSNLMRDDSTNAIINMNYSGYNSYKNLKNIKEGEVKRIDELESEMNYIKTQLNEIKDLIKQVVK